MIPYRQQNEHAAIVRLRANAPLPKEACCESLNGGAFQALDGHNSDLCLGAMIDLAAEIFQLSRGLAIDDVGEVIDKAGRLELLYLFSLNGSGAENNSQRDDEVRT